MSLIYPRRPCKAIIPRPHRSTGGCFPRHLSRFRTHSQLFCRLIRESLPDAVVGLFVHTPFPSSEVFRCLPRELSTPVRDLGLTTAFSGRREILDGMLGANLVCFQVGLDGSLCHLYSLPLLQTYSYLRHFTSTCIRVCGYEATSRGIDVDGRVTAVSHCPVGIDAERVAKDL